MNTTQSTLISYYLTYLSCNSGNSSKQCVHHSMQLCSSLKLYTARSLLTLSAYICTVQWTSHQYIDIIWILLHKFHNTACLQCM